MAVSLEEFQAYVGTDESEFPQECLTAGHALVTNYIGSVTTVPVSVHDQAVLIAASELFHRRSAPSGVSQFASFDGTPMRLARDPMVAVAPILFPFLGAAV